MAVCVTSVTNGEVKGAAAPTLITPPFPHSIWTRSRRATPHLNALVPMRRDGGGGGSVGPGEGMGLKAHTHSGYFLYVYNIWKGRQKEGKLRALAPASAVWPCAYLGTPSIPYSAAPHPFRRSSHDKTCKH